MSQRNPMNDRYRGEKPAGKTRKSAATVKPSTRAGSTVSADPKKKAKADKAKRKEVNERVRNAPIVYTPEESKWRKVWWAMMIVAVGLVCISWAVPSFVSTDNSMTVMMVVVIIAYAALAFMVWVDIKHVRPARNRARRKAQNGYSKKEAREQEDRKKAYAEYKANRPSGKDYIIELFLPGHAARRAKKLEEQAKAAEQSELEAGDKAGEQKVAKAVETAAGKPAIKKNASRRAANAKAEKAKAAAEKEAASSDGEAQDAGTSSEEK